MSPGPKLPMASPTSLADAPTDVLHITFSHLPSTDLYSLCLTSKQIRKFAEPYLYKHIRLIWDDHVVGLFRDARVPSLVRSILTRPELATHVQSLELGGKTGHARKARASTIAYETSQLAPLLSFVDSVKHHENVMADLWKSELERGTMDAFVAVLITQLANLRRLDISAAFGQETEFLGMVLRTAVCDKQNGDRWLPTFEHLREVSYSFTPFLGRPPSIRNTADILPLFYLPSLQSLTACIENPHNFEWPCKSRPLASTLTTLDLGQSRTLRENFLGQILSATPRLTSLRWQFFYRPDNEEQGFGTDTVDLETLVDALAHVRDTLTNLVLMAGTGMWRYDNEYPNVFIKGSLAPLAGFSALMSLELPVAFVLGLTIATARAFGHLLPKNMEIFTFTDDLVESQEDYEWTEEGNLQLSEILQTWLKDCKGHTPRLRIFRLKSNDTVVNDWDNMMYRQLEEACEQIGVTFEVQRPERRSRFR